MTKIKNIVFFLVAVILTVLLVFYGASPENRKINLSENFLLTSAVVSDKSIFVSDKKAKDLRKISSSGVLEMYLDEENLSVCILDTISGKLWRTLPSSGKDETAGNISLSIIVKGREYTLNSQRDSLFYSLASHSVKGDTLVLNYTFRTSLDSGKKIDITLPLSFTLTDGTLLVELECKNIIDNSDTDVYISTLDILPFFGAYNKGQQGDFILLPSGSGIILDTQTPTDKFSEIHLPVYGEDTAKNTAVTSYVPMGAFGMKSGNDAFICLIDSGEAIATIKAQKALTDGTANKVSAEFEITPTLITEDTIYLSKESYDGKISLTYRFLSGNNANYITMAGACRELFIRQGRLSDSTANTTDSYPFNLTLISDTAETGRTTTTQEAQEMISSLITKGISDINIMLKTENTRDLSDLSEFSENEGISLSLMQNLFSYKNNGCVSLSGERNSVSIRNISHRTDELIDIMRLGRAGICLTDCGNMLPTDYSKKGNTRNKILSDISQICTMLSSHGGLTVSKANIYTVKYADNIINIPLSSDIENNPYCKSVPFLQSVLHGICDYSFTAFNLSDDPTKAMLRAIEYGAVPHYEWYFSELEENDIYHYMNSLAQARLVYENMKNIFSDLRDQRITAHEEVKPNVMRTVYSGGSEIYVNYNNKAVTVSGITIDPSGFVRVN